MFVLQPSSSVCYPLNLPIAPGPNLDEATRKKLTLECRTGAAVELARSGVFVHGGLTLPLNLPVINSLQLQKELILYFGKHKNRNTDFKTLADWISPEIFFLDLISRTWQRIITTIDTATGGDSNSDLHFKERLLHSMCFTESNIYIFGGLIVSPQNGYELIGTNELWKLDLKTKCWSLLSKNPQITRRFNHNMHILNENNENQDTKLVIVGGLDNMDIPIKKIDIFNLRTNAWESESKAGTIPDSKPPTKIWVNIDGMPISLSHDSNFSVLIENNEAEVPTLALYYPQDMTKTSRRGTNDDSVSNYTHIADEQSRVPKHPHHSHGDLRYLEEEDTESDSIKTLMSPIVILPLLAKSEGARMTSNPTQNNKGNSILQIPFHLQYPSGNYFNYNIVVIGFYPDPQPSNLHCFIYNIASGKWIKVNISCTECSTNMHRFWKLLIWKSHHQALLLGTKSNDFCSPSVQKFDHILAFSLPMLNGYNKLINEKNSGTSNNVAINCNPKLNLSLYDHLPYPTSPITDQESSHTITQAHTVNDSRLPDLTSSATSQFENYSRYITVPLEMESTSSIFPSYAMVLGKDALEIFGETLSDFEFITADGDSIGVPVYLLRKRWGRYFDSLLSNGYANTSFNYEFNGDPSNIISFSPLPVSKGAKFDYSNQSSNGSLEKFFSKRDNSKSNSNINFKKPHSVDLTSSRSSPKQRALSHSRTSPLEPAFLTNDEEDRTNTSKREEIANNDLQKNSISNKKPTSTTCSSTGMVFRVPFQDIKNSKLGLSEQSSRSTRANSASPPPVHEKSIHYGSISNDMLSNTRSSYRGASTVGATRNNSIDDVYSSIRRASHPLQSHIVAKSSPNSISNPSPEEESSSRRKSSALRFIASPHKSRQPSFASTTSTASVVSSTSGRRRNSNQVSHLRSSSSSPVLPVLNILLPPQEKIPLEPLPPVPNVPSRRSSSLADYVQFSRDSPTASRGSSHSTRKSSCSDMRRVSNSSLLRSTLDSQLLNSSCGNDIPYEASIEEYGMINGRGEEGDEDNGDYNSFLPSNIRPVFSTINAVSINGDFKEGELISAKSYINSEKGRRLSYISNPESVESTNSNNNAIIELEPLLTPRSLYMPWSTASVRAFAEFFYTARINGKWLLAPVTLDLLIMAKTYEIPILYELITEVLYKITSKKEESLLVTCEALLNLFQSKISRYCNENEGKIRRMLDSNESYQDILEIKRSLVNIDNGYIDSYLLRNTSMAQSTDDSNVDTETTDMQHTRVSSLGSLANRAVPTVFAGGPRDSHNSIGSIAFPNSSSVQNFRRSVSLFSPTVKKKSSLSKETDPLDTYDEDAGDMHDSEMVKQHPNPPSTNGINPFIRKTSVDPTDKSLNEFDVGSRSGKPSYDRKEQIEQATLQGISNLDKSKISTSQSGSSGDEKDLQGANGVSKSSDTQKIGSSSNMKTDPFARDEFDSDSGSSSHSDSDDLDSQLGILPFTKMNKKLQEQTSQEFDDSIDPLYKISSSTPGSSRIHGSFSKYIRPSSQREDAPEYTNISSLENMVSPNALPPVDYVMKSIYRVSVLVNDKNLMIRTKEAIGLSKILKKLKKKVLQDISRMDDELREAGKPVDIYPRGSSSPTLSRQHSDITTFIKQQGNARPSLKLATSSPISEAFKKTSSKFIQPGSAQISPRTSVGDFTASQQRRQHMNKRFSTQTTHSTSALFMNPAIMPPAVNAGHRESEEENGEGFVAATKTNKREDVPSIDNDNSGNVFPFFGKRK